MLRAHRYTLIGVLAAAIAPIIPIDIGREPGPAPTTATGWFSDRDCAAPRVARGEIGPNNPDCVKRCLDQGVPAVFIDEEAKALFTVKDYPGAKADVGWHVEVTGVVDREAKTIAISAVKRLEYVGAQCAIPKKKRAASQS